MIGTLQYSFWDALVQAFQVAATPPNGKNGTSPFSPPPQNTGVNLQNFLPARRPVRGGYSSTGGGGTYGASSTGSTSSDDVNAKAEQDAAELGLSSKLETGGSEQDIKKMIEKDGDREAKTVNSPTPSTVKSEMSQEGVTGGVILIPGHAIAVKPGDDGDQAVQQRKQASCWACAAVKAKEDDSADSGSGASSGEPTVYDSGNGTKGSVEQKAPQMQALIVSIKKDKSSAV